MKNMFIAISLLIICIAITSCRKNIFTPVKVTYKVKVKDSNTVVIQCNNDYYFDSKTRKPITWKSDGGYWISDHFAYNEEEYYLKVDYIDSTTAKEDNFKVQIFYNDTIEVASSITDHAVPAVEFKGIVKEL